MIAKKLEDLLFAKSFKWKKKEANEEKNFAFDIFRFFKISNCWSETVKCYENGSVIIFIVISPMSSWNDQFVPKNNFHFVDLLTTEMSM